MIDACQSGQGIKGGKGGRGRKSATNPAIYQGIGRVVIASSQQNQFSYESKKIRHGIFSYVLMQALQGKADSNKDGTVDVFEAYRYLNTHVPKLAKKLENGKQNPVFKFGGSGLLALSFPGTSGSPPPPARLPLLPRRRPKPPKKRAGQLQQVKGLWQGSAVYIPKGTFQMGSLPTETNRDDDENQHTVKLTRGIWMLQTEVTQKQFKRLMRYNPAYFKRSCGRNCPVEKVTWHEALAFANRLSTIQHRNTCYDCRGSRKGTRCQLKAAYQSTNGQTYGTCPGWRLPTEAEWEYAARAGTKTPFHTGRCVSSNQENYHGRHPPPGCRKGRYRKRTIPAGRLTANDWGLYDMLGNVGEWVWDDHAPYHTPTLTRDPAVTLGTFHAKKEVRGGSWANHARHIRAANRYGFPATKYSKFIGFRLVRTHK